MAFLVIGSNPSRFWPLMIPSVVQKFAHVAGVAVLYGQARISTMDAQAASPDLVLGILFVVALWSCFRRSALGFQRQNR